MDLILIICAAAVAFCILQLVSNLFPEKGQAEVKKEPSKRTGLLEKGVKDLKAGRVSKVKSKNKVKK